MIAGAGNVYSEHEARGGLPVYRWRPRKHRPLAGAASLLIAEAVQIDQKSDRGTPMSKSGSVRAESEPIPASAQQVYRESATATELYNRRAAAADASHVVPHLRSGMRLVDFGCGAGSLSLGFAAIVAPGQVVGFDMSEAAVEHARADADRLGLSNVDFRMADINTVDLPEVSFDVAHFSGVLAYQKDPLTTLGIVEVKPGYAPAMSDPHVVAAAIVRILSEGRLSTAILQHDWLTAEQLSAMAESVRVWGESGTSTVAFAECMAVGWKR
jgi:2-polyprenyl-3-methyl-5-hydroxy-6-metoxy-1,4-benzoquinol methylase